MLAFGVDRWPQGAGASYDWKLLLLFVAALLLIRFLVGIRITWAAAAAALVGGTLWGWSIDAWGVLPPTATAILLAFLASSLVRRAHGG